MEGTNTVPKSSIVFKKDGQKLPSISKDIDLIELPFAQPQKPAKSFKDIFKKNPTPDKGRKRFSLFVSPKIFQRSPSSKKETRKIMSTREVNRKKVLLFLM